MHAHFVDSVIYLDALTLSVLKEQHPSSSMSRTHRQEADNTTIKGTRLQHELGVCICNYVRLVPCHILLILMFDGGCSSCKAPGSTVLMFGACREKRHVYCIEKNSMLSWTS
jgi:hypothetical protein